MNDIELIRLIEAEWEPARGFLGQLRGGRFNRDGYQRFLQVLQRLASEMKDAPVINKRLVSLVWYIPIFMVWQRDRVKAPPAASDYERVTNEVQSLVQEILGVP